MSEKTAAVIKELRGRIDSINSEIDFIESAERLGIDRSLDLLSRIESRAVSKAPPTLRPATTAPAEQLSFDDPPIKPVNGKRRVAVRGGRAKRELFTFIADIVEKSRLIRRAELCRNLMEHANARPENMIRHVSITADSARMWITRAEKTGLIEKHDGAPRNAIYRRGLKTVDECYKSYEESVAEERRRRRPGQVKP